MSLLFDLIPPFSTAPELPAHDPDLENVWSCRCGRAVDIPFEVWPNLCPACGKDVRGESRLSPRP